MKFLKNIIYNLNISRVYFSNKYIYRKKINIIKAPLKYGQLKDGVDKGPDFFFNNNLKNIIRFKGWNIQNFSEIYTKNIENIENIENIDNNIKKNEFYSNILIPNQDLVGNFCKDLAEEVYKISNNKKKSFTLILGGDHSISIGSISGLLKAIPNLGIIYIDAHTDIHTIDSTESKNIHGMVNGFLLRLFNPNILTNFSWINSYPKIEKNSLAYIGLRSVDKAEKQILKNLEKDNKIFVSYMKDIDNLGIEIIINNAIKYLGNRPIHISFDIDSLDPSIAPSTGYNCPNGIKYNDIIKLISIIKKKTNLVSMDLVEINPFLGSKEDVNKTLKISEDIINQIL